VFPIPILAIVTLGSAGPLAILTLLTTTTSIVHIGSITMPQVGQFVFRPPSPEPSQPDALTPIHKLLDRILPRTPANTYSEAKDVRLRDIFHAHTMLAFGAIAHAIGEHPGCEARCEEDWWGTRPMTGMRWRWTDDAGEHEAYIEARCIREEDASWFRAERDGTQIGNVIHWPLSLLNSGVTFQIVAHLIRERIHP